jgi:hypothetical protein
MCLVVHVEAAEKEAVEAEVRHQRGGFPRVAERIDLPADARSSAIAKNV